MRLKPIFIDVSTIKMFICTHSYKINIYHKIKISLKLPKNRV